MIHGKQAGYRGSSQDTGVAGRIQGEEAGYRWISVGYRGASRMCRVRRNEQGKQSGYRGCRHA